MFDKHQFRDLVEQVLREIDLHSVAAVQLLLGTAAQESRFGTYLHQLGGPARGVFQMEPKTHADIWTNYLWSKPPLKHKIERFIPFHCVGGPPQELEPELERNLAYAVAMARVHYLRVPEPLPMAGYITGLGAYWKKYYNTPLGKGTVQEFIDNYRRYVV